LAKPTAKGDAVWLRGITFSMSGDRHRRIQLTPPHDKSNSVC
jgi:hypothetical protein